ncbi:MAG: hypothetical protein P8X96_23855, partial [Desulfobacteraceae bacterium]
PTSDRPVIVLWQQTGNGANRTWLAYKEMVDLVFSEDNEDPGNDQLSEVGAPSLWAPQGSNARQHGTSTRNRYYGNSKTDTYNNSAANAGVIRSSFISLLAGYARTTLKFWGWHETEPQRAGFALNDFDRKEVQVLDESGTPIATYVIGTSAAPGDWYREEIDLTPFAGRSIAIQFRFDTVDNLNNDFEGWYIDEVWIESEWPVQNTTLAVGLKEAMVLRFADGFPEIREGDRIYGNSRRTIGRVSAPPLLTAGDWTDASRAQGVLLLNRVSVSTAAEAFVDGELITSIGGNGRARITTYDETNDRKANIIRVYIATEGGIGSANTNPIDANILPYPRLGADDALQWPPYTDARGNWTDDDGNFTAAEDFFRLIQWDALNAGAASIPFRSTAQGIILNAVVQTHHSDLQSLDFPAILSQDEIGLHTFGDGSLNTYFDDFGIRIAVPQNNTLPAPLQQ